MKVTEKREYEAPLDESTQTEDPEITEQEIAAEDFFESAEGTAGIAMQIWKLSEDPKAVSFTAGSEYLGIVPFEISWKETVRACGVGTYRLRLVEGGRFIKQNIFRVGRAAVVIPQSGVPLPPGAQTVILGSQPQPQTPIDVRKEVKEYISGYRELAGIFKGDPVPLATGTVPAEIQLELIDAKVKAGMFEMLTKRMDEGGEKGKAAEALILRLLDGGGRGGGAKESVWAPLATVLAEKADLIIPAVFGLIQMFSGRGAPQTGAPGPQGNLQLPAGAGAPGQNQPPPAHNPETAWMEVVNRCIQDIKFGAPNDVVMGLIESTRDLVPEVRPQLTWLLTQEPQTVIQQFAAIAPWMLQSPDGPIAWITQLQNDWKDFEAQKMEEIREEGGDVPRPS